MISRVPIGRQKPDAIHMSNPTPQPSKRTLPEEATLHPAATPGPPSGSGPARRPEDASTEADDPLAPSAALPHRPDDEDDEDNDGWFDA